MTHTEESLMALADEYATLATRGGRSTMTNAEQTLRLAIREVLAELNERPTKRLWDETATALEVLRKKFSEVLAERSAMIDNVRFARERAEKAEAECDRLRKNLYAAKGHADAYPGY